MKMTRQLVEFAQDFKFRQLSAEAVTVCERHFLDCTGAALAAVNTSVGGIVFDYVKGMGAKGEARLIGSGLATTMDNAALANGILAHAVSFDDSGPSHPSVTVVPPLYAIAEGRQVSGEEIVTAQVIGYEIFQRLNRATRKARQIRDRGWHPTGFFGAVAAALIASKLLGLSTDRALNALGIAASMGAGLSQNIGTMTMPLHAGNASRNGITAALLACRGFTGDHEILEGKFGLMNALAGEGNHQLSCLTAELGKSFCVLDPGINIKSYPHCWGHHKLLQAMLELAVTHDLDPEAVVKIECDLQPEKSTSRYLWPKTVFESKYSIGYGLARALLDRKLELDQYGPEKLKDPAWPRIASKIVHVPQGPLSAKDKFRVTVTLKDETVYSKRVVHAKGTARLNPLSDGELFDKYRKCASRVLPDEKVEASLTRITHLHTLDDASEIMDTLVV